ncbi:hypothetical protein CONPUDRAFT_142843 [Coniophora puteana RWD-64-598 SS2]|uniref:Transposase domain-containing protein n=1 Tax=Coniophora puteana (strain RWD-64-598) TaxID=741705 RepID=A0A5M3MVH6_CONPW|nr:uncharacterized protein CONPUDRAFT_142843 [Coniophora puteana RWD-64-598 SS2]EIW82591.1 hypothetical protein CONPUDRAFT_142843 [Coniophora puteana RWD-64-598 SS2]
MAQLVQCRCRSGRCYLGPQGWTPQNAQTARRHVLEDKATKALQDRDERLQRVQEEQGRGGDGVSLEGEDDSTVLDADGGEDGGLGDGSNNAVDGDDWAETQIDHLSRVGGFDSQLSPGFNTYNEPMDLSDNEDFFTGLMRDGLGQQAQQGVGGEGGEEEEEEEEEEPPEEEEEPEEQDPRDEQGERDEQQGEGDEGDYLDEAINVPMDELFNFSDTTDVEAPLDRPPPCIQDHSVIRNAYVRAFVMAVSDGAKHKAVQRYLEGVHLNLSEITTAHPDITFPGLEKFVFTLPSVLKKLGLATDDFVIYLSICNVCWDVYHPSELHDLDSPTCNREDCPGTIYRVKRLSDGTLKRTPTKIVPYVPLERAIQRLLLRPGKWDQLQHWRGPDDAPGRVPPTEQTGYDAFPDPFRPMTDIYDGWGWRAIQAGLERRRGRRDEIRDVDVHELHQRFVSLPCGLVLQFNIDWFQAVKRDSGGPHSTGAFYVVICNNPRKIRYLAEETMLVMVLPGPHEPTLEQLNKLMSLFAQTMRRLMGGVSFAVDGMDSRQLVHAYLDFNCSDLPSSRKESGWQGHSSKTFMCPDCKATSYSLAHPSCFNPSLFKPRDEWNTLKYAFRAHRLGEEAAQIIKKQRGVSWTPLDQLPGWMPGGSAIVDFMHCIFLGLVKHVTRVVIHDHGLLNGSRARDPAARLEKFFDQLVWPVEVTRLPASISSGHASQTKADQWRNLIAILFVGLFVAWERDGVIPDTDAPTSRSNTKIAKAQARYTHATQGKLQVFTLARDPHTPLKMLDALNEVEPDRNLRRHYDVLLEFSAAIRILATREISPDDVKRGCAALSRSAQSWAHMHLPLTPYFHFSQHLERQFLKHGPCYGWWTYPLERHNHKMASFNHNHHKGGELEGTMMRRWWSITFNYELILQLEALPNPTKHDDNSISLLKDCLQAQQKDRHDSIRLSSISTPAKLQRLSNIIYDLVYQLLWQRWRCIIDLRHLNNSISGGVIFSGDVLSYSHIWVRNLRYGAAAHHRGKSGQYAYISGRQPVEIMHLLHVRQPLRFGDPLEATVAVVRRFVPADGQVEFPWAMWASDLGVSAWQPETFSEIEVVPADALSGHLILAPISVGRQRHWITVAYDHGSPEADPTWSSGDDA